MEDTIKWNLHMQEWQFEIEQKRKRLVGFVACQSLFGYLMPK